MAQLIELIKQVGFPIVVALILLLRYDQRFKEMNKVLGDINENLTKINEHLEG